MNANNIWIKAKEIHIQTSPDIAGNFDIGFDDQIPESTCTELKRFICWVEKNFNVPIMLWVDFEYKHYLLDRNKKRAGYLFYWADFLSYPVFENEDDIPTIRLPVRTEHYTIEEILTSFIEAITCYFAWLTNTIVDGYTPDENDVEEILHAYLSSHSNDTIYI
jgi:hypothetical protein